MASRSASEMKVNVCLTVDIGLVGAGEEVILRRQPENQYDRCV